MNSNLPFQLVKTQGTPYESGRQYGSQCQDKIGQAIDFYRWIFELKSELSWDQSLQKAAEFRGGKCASANWDGDLYAPLKWECAFGHTFSARPFTVLKAGHWCPQCDATWNGDEKAKTNPFFAQVWYADHDPGEANSYPDDCFNDILDADKDWETFVQ